MKTLLALTLTLAIPGISFAGGRSSSRVFVLSNGQLATVVNGTVFIQPPLVSYSYSAVSSGYGAAKSPAPATSASSDEVLKALAAAMLEVAEERGLLSSIRPQAVKQSLVEANCAKCHSGDDPKGGFDVTSELSTEDRFAMLKMIQHPDASKRMPKGSDLDPETRGNLIGEILGHEIEESAK